MNCAQADRHLDAWLDGRLDPRRAGELERHLEQCSTCRARAQALRTTRTLLAADVAEEPGDEVPAGLEARILASLDAEDRAGTPASEPAPTPAPGDRSESSTSRGAVWLLAAGVVALAAAGLLSVYLLRGTVAPPSPPGLVAAAFEAHAEHASELATGPVSEKWRADAAELEQRWSRLDFPTRVLDLSMSGNDLLGGEATGLAGRPAALALYRGAGGIVSCWMFEAAPGLEEALADPVDVHDHGGFRFFVFTRGDRTLVVWREGGVLCALAGQGAREAVVELAHDKAMAPPIVG